LFPGAQHVARSLCKKMLAASTLVTLLAPLLRSSLDIQKRNEHIQDLVSKLPLENEKVITFMSAVALLPSLGSLGDAFVLYDTYTDR
jgi:hypothetical protein